MVESQGAPRPVPFSRQPLSHENIYARHFEAGFVRILAVQLLKRYAARLLPKPALARARAIRQQWLIERFAPYVTSHSYSGHRFALTIEDPLAQSWYDHDWDRPAELGVLAAGRLRSGATVFNLGAHQGVVALMLAAEVGAAGCVVAVEATGHNVRVAHRNFALNDATNILIEHAVAADREGTISFAAGLNGHVGRRSYAFATTELPAVTVDSLAQRYGLPDVVFVDVEGYELNVLAGAESTFESLPDWFIEVHANVGLEEQGGTVAEVVREFERRGYRLFVGDPSGGPFEPLQDPLPETRFFLVALGQQLFSGA